MSILDIPDDDLESLMAEIEAQTQELIAQEKHDIEIERLAKKLEPTVANKLEAEQQVELDTVFSEPEPKPILVAPIKVECDPMTAVEAEPIIEEALEPKDNEVLEPQQDTEIAPREVNLKPKPLTTKPLSESSIKQTMELRFKPDLAGFQRDTKVTDATLDQCISDQASLMAYQVAQHAYAEAQLSRIKQKFSILEAGLYDAYRKYFIEQGEKVTEKAIENAVRLDTKWAQAHLLLIEAQTFADIHKGFVMSLRDRKDMLIQRSVDRREEMKGQVRVSTTPSATVSSQQPSTSMAGRAMEIARASMMRNN